MLRAGGYLAKDFNDMLSTLKVWLKNDKLLKHMGKEGIEFAKQFDWKNVMKQYEKVVE